MEALLSPSIPHLRGQTQVLTMPGAHGTRTSLRPPRGVSRSGSRASQLPRLADEARITDRVCGGQPMARGLLHD
eukprot:5264470-Pleurochrysis_carterae.AAC.1